MSRAASLPGAELFLKNLTFFGRSHLSRAASLPGTELFPENRLFIRSNLSRAASLPGAELFLNNPTFFGRNHLSRAASLPGAEPFSRKSTSFEEATCPGQLRCLGQNFWQKHIFLKKPLVPSSFAAWGRFFSRKSTLFGRNHLSRAASLPGAVAFPQICVFF